MSTLSQFSGGGIKSIQRGTITFGNAQSTVTATITAVNTSKTILNFCGSKNGFEANNKIAAAASITLASSTQVTASTIPVNTAFSGAYLASVSYEVIEYF